MAPAFANSRGIAISIQIPVLSAHRLFRKFDVQAVPHFDSNLQAFVKFDTPAMLYVSTDNAMFFSITEDKLTCLQHNMAICIYSGKILKSAVPSCAYSLYMQQQSNVCKKILISNKDPIIQRMHGDVLFAVSSPTVVTLKCRHADKEEASMQHLTLINTGIISGTKSCEIHGPHFYLASSSSMMMSRSMNVSVSSKIHVSSIIQAEVKPVDKVQFSDIKAELNKLPEYKPDTTSLDSIIHNVINQKNEKDSLLMHTVAGASSSFICMCVVTAAISLIYVCYKCRRAAQTAILPIIAAPARITNNIELLPIEV